jgi:hypothetical protein
MFRIDGIVCQLSLIRRLVDALPLVRKKELRLIAEVANSLSRYLEQQALQPSEQVVLPVDMANRISNLENEVLMHYIRFVKEDRKFTATVLANFKTRVVSAREAIEAQREEQREEWKRWSELAKSALDETNELLYTLASQRAEQCNVFLRSLERSDEVLEVVLTWLEPSEPKQNSDSA